LAGPRKPSQSPWANECWCGGPCNPPPPDIIPYSDMG
jgi:hypothetical protein